MPTVLFSKSISGVLLQVKDRSAGGKSQLSFKTMGANTKHQIDFPLKRGCNKIFLQNRGRNCIHPDDAPSCVFRGGIYSRGTSLTYGYLINPMKMRSL